MRFSNEELTSIAEDAIESIKMAISELKGVEEYKDAEDGLEDIISWLEDAVEPYREAYDKECEAERAYMNAEYERSVL